MQQDIKEVLYSQEMIAQKVKEMGEEISRDYKGKPLVLISVLKGGAVFMADIMRAINLPLEIDFMVVSSYGSGTVSSGIVRIMKDVDIPLAGLDVLVVEDILDSGMTLSYLREHLLHKGANSVKIATLLDKPLGRKVDIKPDYVGFAVPDEFIVGYGLDYDEKYRNLPYIGVLHEKIYSK